MSDGLALSALDWWIEAGVDTTVEDVPRDWLAPAAERPTAPSLPPVPVPPPPAFPGNLAGFRRWLLTDAAVPGSPAARLDGAGDPAAGIVVVADMPEPGDRAAGQLLSGEAGALFDRMLGAMQLGRAGLYLLPFAPARPAAGRIAPADAAALTPLLRRHLALAAPKRLLLLGEAPARALLGSTLEAARGKPHPIEIGDTAVPAVASYAPRLVQLRPELRKPAWSDLQLFMTL